MTDAWIELPAMTVDDLAVPPTLYAVPAADMPPLEPFTRVTYGDPHIMWIIDQAQTISGPYRDAEGIEYYHVVPWAEYGAATTRREALDDGRATVRSLAIPTSDLWVYRPAPGQHTLDEISPPGIADWMDRMVPDVLVPPPVRKPRPARELPSLSGRQLVAPNPATETGWVPAVAMSEPFDQDGAILVRVTRPEDYQAALYRTHTFTPDMVKTVSLHRLWAY